MRLKHLTAKDPGGNALLDSSYEYDTAGNIVNKSTEHGAYTYGYDEASRLTSADNPTGENESYSYDAVGNRTNASNADGSITHNANNELTVYGELEYTYDDNGNMTEIRLDGQVMFRYHYNADNRLVKVEGGNNNTLAEYYYDPFGRRLWKDVTGTRTYFFYSDEGLIAEYDAAGNEIRSYGYTPDSTWTTDPLFLRSGGQYFFYQNDHLGTPQKLTAVNGAVVWSAIYSAFGQATVDVSAITNNLRFPGQYYDAETGLHYNFQRYYAPGIGRYVSVDPIGFAGGDVNLYGYVGNNSVNWIDSLGLEPYPPHVEANMRNIFVPLLKKENSNCYKIHSDPVCCKILEAATLKFIADENETIDSGDWLQDWWFYLGADVITGYGMGALNWVGIKIPHSWKKAGGVRSRLARLDPRYNDIGPANISVETGFESTGSDYDATTSLVVSWSVDNLLTNEGTVSTALLLTMKADLEFFFHTPCCKYERRSVELIVNRLRDGKEVYWDRVWHGKRARRDRWLKTREAFELWKSHPNDFLLPDDIKRRIPPLSAGDLDEDKFKLIEELLEIKK